MRPRDAAAAFLIVTAGTFLGHAAYAALPDDPATCQVERVNATTSRTTCE